MKTSIAAILALSAIAATTVPASAGDAEAVGAIIAAASFAKEKCPTMRPNYPAITLALAGHGVHGMDDLPASAVEVALRFREKLDAAGAGEICPLLWARFGPRGTLMTDVFLPR